MRILSLFPAATEIVYALGLWDQLVGVSGDSDWPPEVAQLPKVSQSALATNGLTSRQIDEATFSTATEHAGGSLYHLDPALLRELRPDLILTQQVCPACAVSELDVAAAVQTLGYAPQLLSLSPSTLEEVLEEVETVGRAAGVADRAVALLADLLSRLEGRTVAAANAPRRG